ncbi:MAG: hypothetical protein ACFNNL_10065 [Kingella oralis]
MERRRLVAKLSCSTGFYGMARGRRAAAPSVAWLVQVSGCLY